MAARFFPRPVIRGADYTLSLCAAATGKGVDPPRALAFPDQAAFARVSVALGS